jgi:hypothetical protein
MQCAHEGCLCQVVTAGKFGSDYCSDHASECQHAQHICDCGHAACSALGD